MVKKRQKHTFTQSIIWNRLYSIWKLKNWMNIKSWSFFTYSTRCAKQVWIEATVCCDPTLSLFRLHFVANLCIFFYKLAGFQGLNWDRGAKLRVKEPISVRKVCRNETEGGCVASIATRFPERGNVAKDVRDTERPVCAGPRHRPALTQKVEIYKFHPVTHFHWWFLTRQTQPDVGRMLCIVLPKSHLQWWWFWFLSCESFELIQHTEEFEKKKAALSERMKWQTGKHSSFLGPALSNHPSALLDSSLLLKCCSGLNLWFKIT